MLVFENSAWEFMLARNQPRLHECWRRFCRLVSMRPQLHQEGLSYIDTIRQYDDTKRAEAAADSMPALGTAEQIPVRILQACALCCRSLLVGAHFCADIIYKCIEIVKACPYYSGYLCQRRI